MRFSGIVMKLFLATVLLGVTLATAASAGAAGTLYVKQGGTGGCSGWTDACDLQTAIGKAVSGDQIWVAAGTYKPSTSGLLDPRTATFTMNDGVAIYGGFAGTEDALSGRNWSSNVTVLSGDLIGDDADNFVNRSDNTYNVVTVPDTVSSSGVLDGFTIKRGNANGGVTGIQDRGGGVQVLGGSPTLANLTVTDSQASFCGGGVQSNGGAPTLTNVRIVGNEATCGGGMYSMGTSGGSPVVLRNVIFSGNSAHTWGGGLYAGQGTMTLTNVLFSGNSANLAGGMAWDVNGSATLTNVTFSGNQDGGYFPALFVYNGTATMVNSIVWDNAPTSVPQIGTGKASNGSGTLSVGYSDVQGGCSGAGDTGISCGSGNANSNPLFVTAVPASPMPNTGGDLHLSAGSPEINLGDNSVATVSTDLGGATRIVGGAVDLGAYEYQGNSAPAIALQPANQTVGPEKTATFTALAGGNPTPTVQWQELPVGSSWTDISGATATTYPFTAQASNNGYQYRAVFTSSQGTATSNAATLAVAEAPTITSVNSATFTVGTAGSFSVTATGVPAPTLSWSGTLPSGVTLNPTSGVLSGTPATGTGGTYNITFKASNGISPDATQTFTLTVNYAPTVTTQPNSETVTAGQTATFSAAASGNPTPTVQWQEAPVGSSWTDISGATATTYSFTAQASNNGYQYRAVFTNSVGSATSNAATLTVQFAPIVTTQPADQSVPVRSTATFTAAADGNPTPTVQWQVSTDNGASWSNIRRATSATYSLTTRATDNGSRYRAIFTNSLGSASSNAATLTITTGGSGPSADVGITQAPGTYDSGTLTITWTLKVTNLDANNAAQGVEVTDTLARGTKLSSVTMSGTGSYVTHGSKVIVSLGNLAGSSSETITIKALVTRVSGTIDNTATVTTTSNDTDTTNNTSTASVTVP